MKKSIFTLAAAVFVAGSMLTGCSSPEKKVDNAEQKVQDAKEEVKDAKQDLNEAQQQQAISEFQQFKNNANAEITANEQRIAQLRLDVKNEPKQYRDRDEKEINALEKRNHELKEKLEAYHDDGKSDWQKFKTEFNHDLEGLGKAFKDITVSNTNKK